MTVSSTESRKNYAGDGVVVLFPTTFKFLVNGDITVILRDTSNAETTLTEITNYTLTGAGVEAGGDVLMIVAPAPGEVLVIQRVTAKTQGVDYVENDPFPAEVHEGALDRLTMIAQETGDAIDVAITAPVSDTDPQLELPVAADRANKFVVFDSFGNVQISSGTGADAGLRADLASNDSGKGASLVGVLDALANFVGTDLETVLADLAAGSSARDFVAGSLRLSADALSPTIPNGNVNIVSSGTGDANLTAISGGDVNLTPIGGGDVNLTPIGGGDVNLTPASGGDVNLTPIGGGDVNLSGNVLNTTLPAFLVIPSGPQSNLPLSTTPIDYTLEIFDQGGDFDVGVGTTISGVSGVFIAPVTGRYQIGAFIALDDMASNGIRYLGRLVSSNRDFALALTPLTTNFAFFGFVFSILIDMDANDTVHMTMLQSGGTVQTDVNDESYLSGHLVA